MSDFVKPPFPWRRDGAVARINLGRPEVDNVLTPSLVRALRILIAVIASTEGVSVIALEGSGPHFCRGLDDRNEDASTLSKFEILKLVHHLFSEISRCRIPLIALIHGPAIDFGAGLATRCDVVLASNSATFLMTVDDYVSAKRGGFRAWSYDSLVRRPITAFEAVKQGIVDEVYSDETFAARSGAFLTQLASQSRARLKAQKQAITIIDEVDAYTAKQYVQTMLAAGRGEANIPAMDLNKGDDSCLSQTRELAIGLRRSRKPGNGLSKLGGLPNLDQAVEWPRHSTTGLPLHFLAQIDLSRIPETPLVAGSEGPAFPKSGLLHFFADLEEECIWDDSENVHAATRVIFTAVAGKSRQPPDDLPEIFYSCDDPTPYSVERIGVYPASPVEAFLIDSFVDDGLYLRESANKESIKRMATSKRAATGDDSIEAWPLHQILGAAQSIQGAARRARERGDILLLQIDTDRKLHEDFTFCDMGMVQYWIRPDDLSKGRFDLAWATTEGG